MSGDQACWLCCNQPIRRDDVGVGSVGREVDTGLLIYCLDCAAILKRATTEPKATR